MLLQAFLIWNSVTSSFQCKINGGIKIAPNVGDILIEQNNVKTDDFWGLGMSWEETVDAIFMCHSCLHKWTYLE